MLDTTVAAPSDAHNRVAARASDTAPAPCRSILAWCVAATVPKAERLAHAELHRRGFEAYLPLITVRRPNRHYRTSPLFPGYLFVRLDLAKPWHPVRSCPGVFSLLTMDRTPSIVAEAEIQALQAVQPFSALPQPWKPGSLCSLAAGPLAGLPAVVTDHSSNQITITLMFLGTLRQISVDAECLTHRSC